MRAYMNLRCKGRKLGPLKSLYGARSELASARICVHGDRNILTIAPTCRGPVCAPHASLLEQIPFGLRVFDSPVVVYGRFSRKLEAFSRRFSGSPANRLALNVPVSYSSVVLTARFSIFTTGMLRPNQNSQSKRNWLYNNQPLR